MRRRFRWKYAVRFLWVKWHSAHSIHSDLCVQRMVQVFNKTSKGRSLIVVKNANDLLIERPMQRSILRRYVEKRNTNVRPLNRFACCTCSFSCNLQCCLTLGCVVQWYNVGPWPACFRCPALGLQLMGDHLCETFVGKPSATG